MTLPPSRRGTSSLDPGNARNSASPFSHRKLVPYFNGEGSLFLVLKAKPFEVKSQLWGSRRGGEENHRSQVLVEPTCTWKWSHPPRGTGLAVGTSSAARAPCCLIASLPPTRSPLLRDSRERAHPAGAWSLRGTRLGSGLDLSRCRFQGTLFTFVKEIPEKKGCHCWSPL